MATGYREGASRRAALSRTEEAQLLGDVLRTVMDERVCARYEQAERLRRTWLQVVPAHLAGHCRIEDFAAGVLKIAADSPAYMHELRLAKKELCGQLNSLAPRCSVKDIKVVIG